MVSIDSVRMGVADYIDHELCPKLTGWKVWVVSAAATAYLNELTSIVVKLKTNEAIKMLNVIDDDNNIDIDKIYRAVRPAADKMPANIPIPLIGTLTMTVSDIDNLYNRIMSA